MTHGSLCLDLTRLLSRVGMGPLTGVDRVERAYADWVLDFDPDPRFFLKTSRGYLFLDGQGGRAFLDLLDRGGPWPRPDLISKVTGKGDSSRHGAEVFLRSIAIDRALPIRLQKAMNRHLKEGATYLNIGHSNVTEDVLMAVKEIKGARSGIFLHDTIPLDFPQFSSAAAPERFTKLLEVTEAYADLILCNSKDTERQIRAHINRDMPIIAAHLGVDEKAAPEELPFDLDPTVSHFLTVGTIEPRKNHALLLDVWDMLPVENRPHLHIVGRRGWAAPELIQRLDNHPLRGTAIFEHTDLSDGHLSSLYSNCRALLFPTFAEGFGLPPVEAARAGIPPICADLPVLREILGNVGVYLDPTDAYSWLETIKQYSKDSVSFENLPWRDYPTWQQHFEAVRSELWPIG